MTGNKLAEVTPKLEEAIREILVLLARSDVFDLSEQLRAILRPFITPASTPPGISQTEWPCGMVLCSHIGCKPLGNDSDILACGHQRKWQIATFDKDDTPDGGSECALCKIDGLATPATPTESVREGLRCANAACKHLQQTHSKWACEQAGCKCLEFEAEASPSVPLLDVDGLAKNIAKLFICNQEKSAKRIAQEIRAALVKKETP